MRVVAAVSGGVDSAVALARVADACHDVTAVHMALTPDPALSRTGSRGCCTIADAHDARRAADVVGVPFYVWDFADTFTQTVVEDFVAEYQAGRTPNPCIRCNEHIKFAALLDRAIALGFDAVATGHYARIVAGPHGPVLRRAVDRAKDQSYVLAVLGADQLRHAMFPLGDSVKDQVRAEAAARGLRVAAKPDSHDICFIPDGDTAGFLRGKLGERPGPIVDEAGAVVGGHDGTYGFTIGQRRGLGVTRPADNGRPRYVLRIEPVSRTVVVGPREHLAVAAVACGSPVYGAVPPARGQCVSVQLRAHARPLPATVTAAAASGFAVTLDDPASGIAAGQSAVLYDDDLVLGQGTIAATTPAGPQE